AEPFADLASPGPAGHRLGAAGLSPGRARRPDGRVQPPSRGPLPRRLADRAPFFGARMPSGRGEGASPYPTGRGDGTAGALAVLVVVRVRPRHDVVSLDHAEQHAVRVRDQ